MGKNKIRNYEELISHGCVESRKIVLDITNRTLQRLDAYERIKSIAHMEGDMLHIGTEQWDLSKKRNVYLVGGGKACNHMAMAFDEILWRPPHQGNRYCENSRGYRHFQEHRCICGRPPYSQRNGIRSLP